MADQIKVRVHRAVSPTTNNTYLVEEPFLGRPSMILAPSEAYQVARELLRALDYNGDLTPAHRETLSEIIQNTTAP